MLKLRILFVFLPLLFVGNAFCQKVIYGKVSDAHTREPLPFTNVFVNHTTIGTVADQDGTYVLAIPRGEYDVVCSFVGYQSFKIQTSARGPDSIRMDIKLVPSKEQLDSVVIRGSADKEWEKLVKQFQKVFLGNTAAAANCVIRNGWSIDLKKERASGHQVLTAVASQPLEIENSFLGYKLFYDLQEFSASKKNDRFSGNVYFVEMQPKDSIQAEQWARNRQQAYRGSVRHLFKSILANRTKEEGFTISVYQTSYNTIQQTSYTPSGIQFDSLNRKYIIPMENDIAVYYKSSPSSDHKVATLSFVNRYVEVDNNGVVFDPLSFTITGYLGRSRVANLLPNDYKPASQGNNVAVPLFPSEEATHFQLPDGTFVAVGTENDELGGLPASPMLDSLEKKVTYYAETRPPEKVYVHFDKPFYYTGEDCWYSAYVVNGSDLSPTPISSVLYLDWIDPSGKVIRHQRLKIESGIAAGDFALDPSLQDGIYTVRAYTRWMRNEDPEFFYYKKVPVFSTVSALPGSRKDQLPGSIDLKFFPEGGTLIPGIMTTIAFKAIDANGKGFDIHGKITDEENSLITTFQSIRNGMGVFPLIAQANKSYYAVLPNGEKFALPLPAEQALSLAVSNLNENRVLVRIRSGNENKSSSAYLLAHSRGSIHFAESVNLEAPHTDIAISKNELPEGVVQLTLFNAEGIPQSERMVFIRKDRGVAVTISSDKSNYQPRDSIFLDVEVKDRDGYLVQTSLSVSITDAAFVSANSTSENIYTQLLLQSDLKGYVEQPGWYFDSVSTQKIYALDLVMLTHGWSRYQWNKMPPPSSEPLAYQAEKGITLEGQITANNKPVINAPFIMMIPQSEKNEINLYETDSLGQFRVHGLDFYDTTRISWRISQQKRMVQRAGITLKTGKYAPPVTDNGAPYQTIEEFKNELSQKLLDRYLKTGVWNLENSILLEEVVIKSKRIETVAAGPEGKAVKPDSVDISSRISTSQFVRRYAGKPPLSVTINGYVEPGDPYIALSTVPIEDVQQVLVFGNIHHGYHVVLWKKNSTLPLDQATIRKKAGGYHVVREFYHPRYGPSDISFSKPDNRMTLYWNPTLRTDQDGNAIIRFYNTDSTKRLLVVVEGIANGIPIHSTTILGEE